MIGRGKRIKQTPKQQTGDHIYATPEEEWHNRPAGAAFGRVVSRSRSVDVTGSRQ